MQVIPLMSLIEVGASADMSQSQYNVSHPTDELHEVSASAHMSQSQHNASHPTDESDRGRCFSSHEPVPI